MRLHVSVREGDYAITSYSPVGAGIARSMIELGGFDVHELGDRAESDIDSRWNRLDETLLLRTCTLDVSPDTPVAALTDLALRATRAAGLASGDESSWEHPWTPSEIIDVWLTDPATDERLPGAGTVADAGLEHDDLVVLCIEHPPSLYRLLPAKTPEKLFSRLVLSERLASLRSEPVVHGVLLYTDADTAVARFVRTHFDELNALTGTVLRIFVMERPSDWSVAKRYWKPHLEPALYRSLAALRWLRWVPYQRAGAYDIARRLGVPVDALPCLILFADHEDDRKLVFPIDGLTIAGVRRLVQEIADVVGVREVEYELDEAVASTPYPEGGGAASGTSGSDEALARLHRAERRLLDALRPVPADPRQFSFRDHTVFVHLGGTVSDQFNFHGQTTFVNRPINTVIADFQNSHGDGPVQRRLGELLQLVLSSSELGEADRERLATLVDGAASDAAQGAPESGKVRGILETVRTVVSDASDIAGPAIGIIGKVLEILP